MLNFTEVKKQKVTSTSLSHLNTQFICIVYWLEVDLFTIKN